MKIYSLTLFFLLAFLTKTTAATWYVRTDGNDANTGNTWPTAFQTLQKAINTASAGDEIWVATGIYQPTVMYGGATNRNKTFFINKNIKIFGGFPGTGFPGMANRNTTTFPTTLSGDLGMQNNTADNAYHVVFIDHVSTDMWLDGLRIVQGNADDNIDPVNFAGGGIYNNGALAGVSSPTIQYCRIENNLASSGGGMFNTAKNGGFATPVLSNCIFAGNSGFTGGGIDNSVDNGTCSPALTDCVFTNNHATYKGGAYYSLAVSSGAGNGIANPVVTNCSFTNNTTDNIAGNNDESGGAIYCKDGYKGLTIPTITGCIFNTNTSEYGGAIWMDLNSAIPVIEHCTFGGNTATNQGGAVYFETHILSESLINDCTFTNNTAPYGGAVYLNCSGTDARLKLEIKACTFANNTATENGGAIYSISTLNDQSAPIIRACIFHDNTAKNGGGLFAQNPNHFGPYMITCLFYNNTATQWGGATGWGGSSGGSFLDCTCYGNTATLGGGVIGVSSGDGRVAMSRSITWGNSSTFGKVAGSTAFFNGYDTMIQESDCPSPNQCGYMIYNTDPLFVNAAAHDFHLSRYSPMKNSSFLGGEGFYDIDGDTRPQGPLRDMGFDEIPLECPGGIVYVDKDAVNGNNDGTSWANAFRDLDDALIESNYCNNVTEIWVAEGVYLPKIPFGGFNSPNIRSFIINSDVKIYGGFAGTESAVEQRNWNTHVTTLSGDIGVPNDYSDNAYHVVIIRNRSSAMELDGFTITKGRSYPLGNSTNYINGAGIYNFAETGQQSNPTIRNCKITDNQCGNEGAGAGLYNHAEFGSASPILENCIFSNNIAPGNANGGAICNYAYNAGNISSPVLNNCTFINNTAGAKGGGMYNSGLNGGITEPVLTNCTFNGNQATSSTGGAIYHIGRLPVTLNDCVFSNNTAFETGAVSGSAVTANNCMFTGNHATAVGAGALNIGGNYTGFEAISAIQHCTFANNTGVKGGALSIITTNSKITTATFEACVFSANTATVHGGAISTIVQSDATMTATMTNCQFYDNMATGRGGVLTHSYDRGTGDFKFINCTMYHNTATQGGVVSIDDSYYQHVDFSLRNCITWNNGTTFAQTPQGEGVLGIIYTDIDENTCPTGAICGTGVLFHQDPLFVNAAAHNFHLKGCSPAIDAGSSAVAPANDFDGTARPQGAADDMGAFEYTGGPCIIVQAICKNITVNLNNSGAVTVPASGVDNGSTACVPMQLQINGQASQLYTCANLGANIATLKVTDCNNATSTCTATITVADMIAPTVVCQPATLLLDAAGAGSITAGTVFQSGSDNCGTVNLVSVLPNSFGCNAVGVNTVILTVNDGHGNTATCNTTVTVSDTERPTITCQPAITRPTQPYLCGTDQVQLIAPYATDNCTVQTIVNDAPSFFPTGNTTVIWTVTDQHSNSSTCTQTVMIKDNIVPFLQCPDNQTITSVSSDCAATVDFVVQVHDNCGAVNIDYSHEPGAIFEGGSTLVEVAATDESGNSTACSFWVLVQASAEKCDGIDNDCDGLIDEPQGFVQVSKQTDLQSGEFDQFANAVAIDGNTAVAGVKSDDEKGFNAGAAQIFSRNEQGAWVAEKRLYADDANSDDQFGNAVAIKGDFILVAANLRDDNGINNGAVYVFGRNTSGSNKWGQVTKLAPIDAISNQNFGTSIAFDGRFAIVGANLDDEQAENAGAAYIFDAQNNWAQVAKLTAFDGQSNDDFGAAVSIADQEFAIAGAAQHDLLGDNAGAAYLFRRNTNTSIWSLEKKLSAATTAAGDRFGFAVALSGKSAVIGAPRNDFRKNNGGLAYVFDRNKNGIDQWGESSKLFAYDSETGDQLGRSVAVSGNLAVVATPYENAKGSGAGAAYTYLRLDDGVWIFLEKIVDPTGNLDDNLFTGIALSDRTIMAGAPRDDDAIIVDRGSVQWFEAPCADALTPNINQGEEVVKQLTDLQGIIRDKKTDLAVYPMPFSTTLTVDLFLPDMAPVATVIVCNTLGQTVAQVHQGALDRGTHQFTWAPEPHIAAGTYFLRVETGVVREVRKVVYVKE